MSVGGYNELEQGDEKSATTAWQPAVSVVTANFNHGKIIENLFRSIAEQTEAPIEHIVVDDASTDDSRDRIRALQRQYPFVRLIESERNSGPGIAVSRGAHEAKGDFLMILSADDSIPPWALKTALDVARQNPDARLISGDVDFVSSSNGRVIRRNYLSVDREIYLPPKILAEQQRRTLYVINGAAAIVRRESIMSVGMDNQSLRWHCDWMAYNTIAFRYGVWYVPKVLHRFTLNGGSFGTKAHNWEYQKPVLESVFELLDSEALADVRAYYKRSAILAPMPFILRFLAGHPAARRYLTWSLVVNATLFWIHAKVRGCMPQRLMRWYVGLRTLDLAN